MGDGGSQDQKDRSPYHEQGWGLLQTIIIVHQVAGEENVAVCHKWHSTSALMMPIVIVWQS